MRDGHICPDTHNITTNAGNNKPAVKDLMLDIINVVVNAFVSDCGLKNFITVCFIRKYVNYICGPIIFLVSEENHTKIILDQSIYLTTLEVY